MIRYASDPASGALLQYGAVGVLALLALLAVRILFARLETVLEQERQRADRLELELLKLHESIRNEYISTITASTHAASEASRAVADALAVVRRT